jgi:hypothetical protein
MTYYESRYDTWVDVHYNRQTVNKFFERLTLLTRTSTEPLELENLNRILEDHGEEYLRKFYQGDEEISRLALIENWSRKAAIDILYENKYSKETLRDLLNLPVKDYQLVMKRVNEIVNAARSIPIQDDNIGNIIPT